MIANWTGDPTNLVLYGQFQPHEASPCLNPRPFVRHVDPDTAETFPVRCRQYGCPPCLRVLAVETARAIAAADPTHFVTFTQVGRDWPSVQERMERLLRRLRRRCGSVAWAWTVEPFMVGGWLHVHAFIRADDRSLRRELSAALASLGIGRRVHVAHARWFSTAYVFKMLLNGDESICQAFLEVNGGRIVHASRDFWRDRAGRPVQGVRAARAATRASRRLELHFVADL